MSPLVVIVEDDVFAGFLFTQALAAHGYGVVVLDGEDDVSTRLAGLQPAALLVDLHLGERHDRTGAGGPEISGLEILRRLRGVPSLRRVPAAIITGDYFTDARVSSELERLGVDLHLKPLWNEALVRLVDAMVTRSTGIH
jgi:CheY-like chemotaxis protein